MVNTKVVGATSAADTPTDYLYTGQRLEEEAGLYYYNTRFYDAALAHFVQADTMVQDPGNFLSYDKYACGLNNPVKFTDPTGHFAWLPVLVAAGAIIGAAIDYGCQVSVNYHNNGGDLGSALTTNIDLVSIGESAIAGSAIGLSVAVLGPVAVGVVGEGLTGIGLLAGSTTTIGTTVFSAGVSVTEASVALSSAIYGISTVTETNTEISSLQSESLDDWTEYSGQLRDAASGKGNFGIGEATSEKANILGDAWVGNNPRTTNGGILISQDGLRQYRPPSFKPNLGRTQANLEYRFPGWNKWFGNAHIDIIEK